MGCYATASSTGGSRRSSLAIAATSSCRCGGLPMNTASGIVAPSAVDEDTIGRYLHTRGMPDPDLLIRPGGEARLSNFLLYQLAYTELWMTDVYWPDFTRETFALAIADFARRARRYGGA